MQEKFCPIANDALLLSQSIIETGDIDSLIALAQCVNDKLNTDTKFSELEILVIYYLYYVWMDDELRQNFPSIHQYLLNDQTTIWTTVLSDKNFFEEAFTGQTDAYFLLLREISDDIAFRMTAGEGGKQRPKTFCYSVIQKMFEINYSSIPDFILKLLFIGYKEYGRELFLTDLEFEYFSAFLFNKKDLVYCKQTPVDLEEAFLEMKIVD